MPNITLRITVHKTWRYYVIMWAALAIHYLGLPINKAAIRDMLLDTIELDVWR
jgi:hypothetical protein